MSKSAPIEETVIAPDQYEDFAPLFPTIYHTLAETLNRKAETEGKEITLTTEPTTLTSFHGLSERTALVFIIGSSENLPTSVYLYASFGLVGNINRTIYSHVPGQQTIFMAPRQNLLVASLNSGKGRFRIRILHI